MQFPITQRSQLADTWSSTNATGLMFVLKLKYNWKIAQRVVNLVEIFTTGNPVHQDHSSTKETNSTLRTVIALCLPWPSPFLSIPL